MTCHASCFGLIEECEELMVLVRRKVVGRCHCAGTACLRVSMVSFGGGAITYIFLVLDCLSFATYVDGMASETTEITFEVASAVV